MAKPASFQKLMIEKILLNKFNGEILMYQFSGKWITNDEFCQLKPRNIFHRQYEPIDLPCNEHRNRHILFRKTFCIDKKCANTKIYISADDYYKLYVNGHFVGQGPSPSYHFNYNYNIIDITDFLIEGENLVAVHTLYQGLINRVWQSGDNRHGLILDIVSDDKLILSSDETFKTKVHSGYREIGIAGYETQFLEEYNSNSAEVGFEQLTYDDSLWDYSRFCEYADYSLTEQKSKMLVFEKINPNIIERKQNRIFVDFGSNYVGYLHIKVDGKKDELITIRCGQELDENNNVRYKLRAICDYEETWVLTQGESVLDQFDYKSFRYVELLVPDNCEVKDLFMQVRHYPFELMTNMKSEYNDNPVLKSIWDLCVHTQKYGVQEVIQDCMEREKGFYIGDGCYTALANMIMTRDDSMVRKLIDDGFATDFITEGLVTCLNCSFMQEIAEYSLMLIYLVLWHYRFTEDKEYLAKNYLKVVKVLDYYRERYERNFLLCNLDKWCVVEWPKNYQDDYDVDVVEGKICHEAHVSINAYYIESIKTANKIAKILNFEQYRDEKCLLDTFIEKFYDKEKQLFKDGINTDHISIVGNVFPFAFDLCADEVCKNKIANMIKEKKISSLSLFCTFLALMGFIRMGKENEIEQLMLDEGAWLRMLSEGATTTFEGWGKETKWNTSLFHLTMSYGAVFLADVDLKMLFE